MNRAERKLYYKPTIVQDEDEGGEDDGDTRRWREVGETTPRNSLISHSSIMFPLSIGLPSSLCGGRVDVREMW